MTGSSGRRFLTWLSPRGVVIAALIFVLADVGDQLVAPSVLAEAPLDETAHLLTTLLVLWAIGGVVFDRLLIPALVASVAIDLDHLPQELGDHFLTRGTPRPYTHSLIVIAIVLATALLWPRRRQVLLGVALGLAIHLWRDMAEPESGVALFWPFSDASYAFSYPAYLVIMALVVLIGLRRSLHYRRHQGAPKTQCK